jgi:hypothetical protein
VGAVEDYLRYFLFIETSNPEIALNLLQIVYDCLSKTLPNRIEPRLNIISGYNKDGWRIFIFPRDKHRPDQYFKDDENKILLSPASVDMGGICITPLENDFLKITKNDLVNIYEQVSVGSEIQNEIKIRLLKQIQNDL